jgi:hypothetical protein
MMARWRGRGERKQRRVSSFGTAFDFTNLLTSALNMAPINDANCCREHGKIWNCNPMLPMYIIAYWACQAVTILSQATHTIRYDNASVLY